MINILKNIGLLIAGLLIALLAGEGFIRLIRPQEIVKFDPQLIWRPDSLTGWRHVENSFCYIHGGDRTSSFYSDEIGYRVDSLRENIDSNFRILMIGDSFIEGLSVENEETVSGQLEKILSEKYDLKCQVINDGVGGWSPRQYFLESKHQLSKHDFDLGIIFLYVANDFSTNCDTSVIAPGHIGSRQLRLPKSWTKRELKNNLIGPINDWFETWSHLFLFLKKRNQTLLSKLDLTAYYFPSVFLKTSEFSDRWGATAELCYYISLHYKNREIPVLFVLLPAIYQVHQEVFYEYVKGFDIPVDSVDLDMPGELFKKAMAKHSLSLVDPLSSMRVKKEAGIRMFGYYDRHLDADGHFVVAEFLAPYVVDMLGARLDTPRVDSLRLSN